jgi:hypothetical protein
MSEFEACALDYAPPVAELLELGEEGLQWVDSFDYVDVFELSTKDVPELLRMAADEQLNTADSESLLAWAPIHAIQALGQLRAAEAVEPLWKLIVCDRDDECAEYDDWLFSAVTNALVEIGLPAVGSAIRLIHDQSKNQHSRAAAAAVLSKLGRQELAVYPQCVEALATALEQYRDNHPALNGLIISSLLDLDAEETCPLIEQAFAGGAVSEFVAGDWEDVQIELGQLPPLSEAAKREKMYRRFPETQELAKLVDRMCEQLSLSNERARSSKWSVSDLNDNNVVLEESPEQEKPSRMRMPEDLYSADERRRIAKQRNRQRKIVHRAKKRNAQAKHRH